jgi:hypothetical protein
MAAFSGLPRGLAVPIARVAFPDHAIEGAVRTERVSDGLGDLANDIWGGEAAGIRIDEAWWEWRYRQHPEHPYEFFEFRNGSTLEAAAVVRLGEESGQGVLQVLDLVARSRRSARAVVDAAIASAPGVGGLRALATAGGIHAKALSWAGFRRVPRRIRRQRSHLGILQLSPLTTDPFALKWTMGAGTLDYT